MGLLNLQLQSSGADGVKGRGRGTGGFLQAALPCACGAAQTQYSALCECLPGTGPMLPGARGQGSPSQK